MGNAEGNRSICEMLGLGAASCPTEPHAALLWSAKGPRHSCVLGARATPGVRVRNGTGRSCPEQQRGGGTRRSSWGSYRYRGARDRGGLCHSGHSPRQRGGHGCCNGTGAGDVHAVALGALHVSLVTGGWGRICRGREQAERGQALGQQGPVGVGGQVSRSPEAPTWFCPQGTRSPGGPYPLLGT